MKSRPFTDWLFAQIPQCFWCISASLASRLFIFRGDFRGVAALRITLVLWSYRAEMICAVGNCGMDRRAIVFD